MSNPSAEHSIPSEDETNERPERERITIDQDFIGPEWIDLLAEVFGAPRYALTPEQAADTRYEGAIFFIRRFGTDESEPLTDETAIALNIWRLASTAGKQGRAFAVDVRTEDVGEQRRVFYREIKLIVDPEEGSVSLYRSQGGGKLELVVYESGMTVPDLSPVR